ncbi:helicase HerA-like domain-containing protein [Enterorhabdus sp. P55]|uniref:helicase HerA-like domain-containing protein n=1 Tax=Enterorhabdus sp. P55 TaxID=2304571 RepID=UPI00191C19EE|nr:helicase HerA-like domain-containing protein [Enterorhabdus sp. P55]
MLEDGTIRMAQAVDAAGSPLDVACLLRLDQANRHGLIAGASGTGKTVTLKVMAEGFSQAGVPVFMADVKGDVTGMAQAADDANGKLAARAAELGAPGWAPAGCPVRQWDMLGGPGIPVRVTVSDMGPVLLARLLGLTEVQEGVLNVVFRVADDRGMLLIDLKDLRALLNYVGEHAKEFELEYGRVSPQSVGAILRALIAVEDQGGDVFFGEPALDLADWFACDEAGRGYVNLLNAAGLITSPQVYAMFLLWMLSELFETLPEVGDGDRPRFVFFFDEAHLLFDDMPKELVDRIVQVVKLIRSKGVGVYFITQSPSDIPDEVLAQLSNRIQHGLRAYTPAEQKTVRAAAAAFRANPDLDAEAALGEVGTGEALVSLLDEEGRPSVVQRAKVLPPECSMGAAPPETMAAALEAAAPLAAKYGQAIDRESAYELIAGERAAAAEADALAAEREALERERAAFEAQRAAEDAQAQKAAERERERLAKEAERARVAAAKEAERAAREAERQRAQAAKAASSVLGQIGREAGRQLVRGLFGALKR